MPLVIKRVSVVFIVSDRSFVVISSTTVLPIHIGAVVTMTDNVAVTLVVSPL